jgi:hypothetical protein
MKKIYLVISAVVGATLALPVTAHHNSVFYDDLVIGDMMDLHDNAIENLNLPDSAMGAMDPSNGLTPVDATGSMPEDLDPQPNGTQIPDEPGTDNGGNTAGEPWPID